MAQNAMMFFSSSFIPIILYLSFVADSHVLQQQLGLLHILRLHSQRQWTDPQPLAGGEHAGQQKESCCLYLCNTKGYYLLHLLISQVSALTFLRLLVVAWWRTIYQWQYVNNSNTPLFLFYAFISLGLSLFRTEKLCQIAAYSPAPLKAERVSPNR